MTEPTNDSRHHATFETIISILRALLDDGCFSALKAHIAISAGSKNEAIGWLLDIEPKLKAALSLYEATLVIHRQCKEVS